jgi:serine protease Do
VVDGVDQIEVRFLDGNSAEAEVIGKDPKTDLALIRVEDASDLHVLSLGDSDEILPGDWVVAIGNPFGLDHTVTVGIVSAKGREIGQGPYDDFIQTDAAINPGNSGGPLLNMRGEVVGINTAINPQANTIGFAVPSNIAASILPQLREKGHVVRGWLGVAIQPVTKELEEAFSLSERKGALVAQVTPKSPAEKAGIERGDVIVRFGEAEIEEPRDLSRRVAESAVGGEVDVVVLRDGKRRTLEVEIGKLEEPQTQASRAARSGLSGFGLRVDDLSPTMRQRYGIEAEKGVVVTDVDPGGPAAAAGIREGDVILEADREPVDSAADLARALEDEESALVLLSRGETTLFVPLKREK